MANGPNQRFSVLTLAKGWFSVHFEIKEAAEWVLKRNWSLGNIPVLFKKWSPMFDAAHEKVDVFPVWVRAPGLPSFLWVESVFKAIGNRLGTYLEADMSFQETHNRAMARILVSLNPSGGLAEKINLQYKEYVFEQILDYEYFPFRCHRCHEYGHLAKEFPLGRRWRRFHRTRERPEKNNRCPQVQKNKEISVAQEDETMDVDPQQGSQEQRADLQVPSKESTEDGPDLGEAKEITDEVPPRSTPSPAEDPKGMILNPKHSSLPNIENKDECLDECLAVDLLNNTSRSEINVINVKMNNGKLENCIESLSAAIPSLDMNCDGCCLESSSQAQQPLCPYNLRSLVNKPISMSSVGGIDPSSTQS